MKLKFIYFAPADIQIARVDRQCIVYFCEALQKIGVDVELVTMGVCLMKDEIRVENPLDLYRIEEKFPVKIIPTLVHQEGNPYWGVLNRIFVHLMKMISYIERHRFTDEKLVFYIKNYSSTAGILFLRRFVRHKPFIVFEAHLPPKNAFQRFIIKRVNAVVANSFALAGDLVLNNCISSHKIIGTHQGINLKIIQKLRISKKKARGKLGLPLNKKLAIYTGKVYYGYKEIDYLIEAAKFFPSEIELIIVGGRADHVQRLQEKVANGRSLNVKFVGFVPPNKVQYYQFAADVLLLYYPSNINLNQYRSPGKLFEYMASGRPIISVDLPVLREVLGDNPTAMMIPADAPQLLSQAIINILKQNELSEELANRSLQRVTRYTWEERAKTIVKFIKSLNEY